MGQISKKKAVGLTSPAQVVLLSLDLSRVLVVFPSMSAFRTFESSDPGKRLDYRAFVRMKNLVEVETRVNDGGPDHD